MAQFGIQTYEAYKNDSNGWEPNVNTAKSAAATPRRARRRAGSLQRSIGSPQRRLQKAGETNGHTDKSAAAAPRHTTTEP
jgi:hypothetical protein